MIFILTYLSHHHYYFEANKSATHKYNKIMIFQQLYISVNIEHYLSSVGKIVIKIILRKLLLLLKMIL